MKFLTKEELNCKKNKFISKEIDDQKHHDHFSFLSNNIKPGQFFLYERISHSYSILKKRNYKIYYPKLAIYLDSYDADQTIEIEYKDIRRNWEHRTQYTSIIQGKEYSSYASEIHGVNTTILWDDDIYVYGIWDTIPNWKELKKSYEKTIWFSRTKEELRDIRINSIIRN